RIFAEVASRRSAANAEKALSGDDALHADRRQPRPRHDVPNGDGTGEPGLWFRSRHGQKAARLVGIAADCDGAVRLLAIYGRQAERFSIDAQRSLARYG